MIHHNQYGVVNGKYGFAPRPGDRLVTPWPYFYHKVKAWTIYELTAIYNVKDYQIRSSPSPGTVPDSWIVPASVFIRPDYLVAYPDAKCSFGYMLLCQACAGSRNIPHWVNLEAPILTPPALGKLQTCEVCKIKRNLSHTHRPDQD